MHDAAYVFIAQQTAGQLWHGCTVIEIGSYHVNGSVRGLFRGAQYTGIDARPGPGVDIVARAVDFAPPHPVDCVVSTEALEHDEHAQATIACAVGWLKPGGRLLLTAAAPERMPHGNDGGGVNGEHYAPIVPRQLRRWLRNAGCVDVVIRHDPMIGDVYASARRGAR